MFNFVIIVSSSASTIMLFTMNVCACNFTLVFYYIGRVSIYMSVTVVLLFIWYLCLGISIHNLGEFMNPIHSFNYVPNFFTYFFSTAII